MEDRSTPTPQHPGPTYPGVPAFERPVRRTVRAGAAIAAVGLLVAGASWRSAMAVTSASSAAPAAAIAQSAPSTSMSGMSRAAAMTGRDSYADVVKIVAPAVVTIRTEGQAKMAPTDFNSDDQDMLRRFFGDRGDRGDRGTPGQQAPQRRFKQRGLGSGVIVTPDGYVLTNNHVIEGADDIRVELTDNRTFKAKLVGADKPSDLALLKLDAAGLPSLSLGNSDVVQVGDVVLAVGNPLGIGQTVTMGIVSAKGRSTGSGDGSYEDFLQTDAPINHGNSGGALVNLKGELVGINSQIVSQSDGNIGIGFAIPANMANHVLAELKTDGRVRRAQLGVTVQPVTSEMAENLGLKQASGAIVSSVAPGSAAERAGIKRGDIITSFDGQLIRDFNSLRNRVGDTAPGSSATVGILRDGNDKTLTVKLDEAAVSRSASAGGSGENSDKEALGVAVSPLTPDVAQRAGLPRDLRGVIVEDVNPDGRAADAGIQKGDVILEVNRQPVQTPDDLRTAVRRATTRPTLLLVNRDGKDLFVTVRPS